MPRKRITVYNEVGNDFPETLPNKLIKKNDERHSNNADKQFRTHFKSTMFGLVKVRLTNNIKTKN